MNQTSFFRCLTIFKVYIMLESNSFVVSLIIRRPKKKETNLKCLIYLRMSYGRQRIEISTKEKVNEDNWDIENGRVKGNSLSTQQINIVLDRLKEQAILTYRNFQFTKEPFTVFDIKNKIIGIEANSHTLMELFEYHNQTEKKNLAIGTFRHYQVTIRYIQEFLEKELKVKDINLDKLSYSFLSGFENYILKRNITAHKECGHNAIVKHILRLRKVVNIAIRNEWITHDPFGKFVGKCSYKQRDYLTKDELNSIENKIFTIKRLEQVKDLFIFSCYTGLSYIDAQNLTRNNLAIGIDGELWVKTHRQKTSTEVNLPLLPTARNIIEKYQYNPRVFQSGKLLPEISNQKLNAYLKEVADVCGIQKSLTTHVARHTFATTVTLTNGVPIESVSKMLGHTSIKTTQIYAKIIDSKVSDDMLLLKAKLFGNTTIGLQKIG